MINYRLLFFILLCVASTGTQAQVNLDSMASYYASVPGQKAYEYDVQRLNALDSTLEKKDFINLYYGAAFQPHYQLTHIDSIENKIKEYNLLQEFMSANELADSLLRIHPISITAYFEKSFACYGLKRTSEEAINRQKYLIFSKCVLTSGNGLPESPFLIVSYNDAIEVVKYLQVKYKQITLQGNNTLAFELHKKYQGIHTLYFQFVNPLP